MTSKSGTFNGKKYIAFKYSSLNIAFTFKCSCLEYKLGCNRAISPSFASDINTFEDNNGSRNVMISYCFIYYLKSNIFWYQLLGFLWFYYNLLKEERLNMAGYTQKNRRKLCACLIFRFDWLKYFFASITFNILYAEQDFG